MHAIFLRYMFVSDGHEISFRILIEFQETNLPLLPMKLSENLWFSDDLRGNWSYRLNFVILDMKFRSTPEAKYQREKRVRNI